MNDLQKIYPIAKQSEGIIDAYIDPETGEILDQDNLPEPNKDLQVALVNKAKMARGTQKMIADEIENLQQLLGIHKRREESVKNFLHLLMTNEGVKKVDLGTAVISIKKNPPKLVVDQGANVDKYTKIETVEKVDKVSLKEDLKAGHQIEGCRIEQGERVEIK